MWAVIWAKIVGFMLAHSRREVEMRWTARYSRSGPCLQCSTPALRAAAALVVDQRRFFSGVGGCAVGGGYDEDDGLEFGPVNEDRAGTLGLNEDSACASEPIRED